MLNNQGLSLWLRKVAVGAVVVVPARDRVKSNGSFAPNGQLSSLFKGCSRTSTSSIISTLDRSISNIFDAKTACECADANSNADIPFLSSSSLDLKPSKRRIMDRGFRTNSFSSFSNAKWRCRDNVWHISMNFNMKDLIEEGAETTIARRARAAFNYEWSVMEGVVGDRMC